ncbi:hypothetical protein PVL30_001779 [Lodderomyces elongisporus]|uniref:uncharacterized protein n=1 Tax=Lodderomyces elongisporus TaxID=36914 RepID=UPI00291EF92C|nr:uncharacterized protein PVL30_001779 [Lodderomyces elongisporus]WLF78053.1 hypothetical protein PVL30_001779 [Lodderomyces elongisporus]
MHSFCNKSIRCQRCSDHAITKGYHSWDYIYPNHGTQTDDKPVIYRWDLLYQTTRYGTWRRRHTSIGMRQIVGSFTGHKADAQQ